jgi:hypothetical protein
MPVPAGGEALLTGDRGLEFMPEGRVPLGRAGLLAREAWSGRLAVAAFLLAVGVAAPILAYRTVSASGAAPMELSMATLVGVAGYAVGGLVVLVVTLCGLLGGWAFLSTVLAAWKPSNWVLCATEAGLYLKLRGFTDHRLAAEDAVVAFIPRREVRWLRSRGERARVVGTRRVARPLDDALARQQYLEIRLQHDDLAALEARLDEERRRWVRTFLPGVTMKAGGTPIAVRDDGVVRIDWRTKGSRLSPRLAAARARLARHYRFAEDVETEQARIAGLDRDAQESRILEMVAQGNSIDAVTLAKSLYGFDTTEAKRFLAELEER